MAKFYLYYESHFKKYSMISYSEQVEIIVMLEEKFTFVGFGIYYKF